MMDSLVDGSIDHIASCLKNGPNTTPPPEVQGHSRREGRMIVRAGVSGSVR